MAGRTLAPVTRITMHAVTGFISKRHQVKTLSSLYPVLELHIFSFCLILPYYHNSDCEMHLEGAKFDVGLMGDSNPVL